MNTARLYLLFLIMTASTSFAGQGDTGGQAEPECDYITGVDTLQQFLRLFEPFGDETVADFIMRQLAGK